MKRFRYKAKSVDGKTLSGIVEAANNSQAASLLREKSLIIISIRPDVGLKQWLNKYRSRTTLSDVTNFTRQLATMVASGLPLVDVLSTLENQSKRSMAEVISGVKRKVEGGASLSESLADHPKVFSRVYVALVKAGEASGMLDKILTRLAEVLEKQADFRAKIKGALMYPAIILAGMGAVVVIMMVFVIPKLAGLYEEFEVDLPITTKILIRSSSFVTNYWWLLLAVGGGIAWTLKLIRQNPFWLKRWERLGFKIPVVGTLKKQIVLSGATRTLSLLVGAGVSIVKSLEIVAEGVGNSLYEADFKQAMGLVEKGYSLAQALSESEYFPSVLPQMVAVGEETGKLDEVLEKVSIYFEKESDQTVRELTALMEPLIMVLLGSGIGFLVFSIVMPIYNLTNAF